MLYYAVEYSGYGENCDACQSAVTVIMSSNAVKSCIETLTLSCIIQTKEIL